MGHMNSAQHWGPYEVFSVLSGVILVIGGSALPISTIKDRFYTVLTGSFLIAYGIYVSRQTEGTFSFPWFIFVIPFVVPIGAALYLFAAWRERRDRSDLGD